MIAMSEEGTYETRRGQRVESSILDCSDILSP